MDPIICSKDANTIIQSINKYLQNGNRMIKDIQLVEANDTQVVFLVDAEPISQEAAKIWWSGYSEGMKAALG